MADRESVDPATSEQWITIPGPAGRVAALINVAPNARSAVIMVGGAGGGIHGPSGIYAPLAQRLQHEQIYALRLEYRHPNQLAACVQDVNTAIWLLEQHRIEQIILVGWSFGGAVVITAGAASNSVVGVATVASQTYGTEAVSQLAPRQLLLFHGTADTVLPVTCAQSLFSRAHEPKQLVIYPEDDHGLTRHADQLFAELLDWSLKLLRGT
ncbi:MAG: dienelactone hydrolase family protein [Chloroflexi bacterium]|nr:dienelactone hydrolase family protein [Chloroflexota bacterium]